LAQPLGDGDLVRKIKDSLDIVDLIGSYIELKQRGANYLALCPFHAEKTPSFSVNRQGQFFHCFGCKKSGDVFDFVMAMEGISFGEALKQLGERCGIQVLRVPQGKHGKKSTDKRVLFKILESATLWFQSCLKHACGSTARQYLSRRQIDDELCSQFKIGYATESWDDLKNRLMADGFNERDLLKTGLVKRSDSGRTYDLFRNRLILPIFDIQGRVIGFGGRVLDDSLPKYINSPETEVFWKSRSFYGLNLARQALSASRTAVIVEGYTDVIAAHGRGVTGTIATLGTALTDEHALMLRRMVDRVVLLFDGDEAGSQAANRGVEKLLSHDLEIRVVTLAKGMDPFDFFQRSSAEDFDRLVEAKGEDFFDFTLRHLAMRFDSSTPGGKAKIARALMKKVSLHQDPIVKDLLLQRIAQKIGVSEKLLRREYFTVSGETPRGPQGALQDGSAAPRATVTSCEDDLILGLLKSPELAGEFMEALRDVKTADPMARQILDAILSLHEGRGPEVRELTTLLWDNPAARNRVIVLASDTRKTDPRELVRSSLEALKRVEQQKAYLELRRKQKDLMKEKGAAEADHLLKEITEKLKKQKGVKRDESNP
jgi:DNA primase